jgi:predicted Fe-S protein YdhL (DUF1289 family)
VTSSPAPAPGAPTILLSPCVGVCRLDPASRCCQGCGRSETELERWSELDDTAKLAIWARLPARLREVHQPFHLLPWSGSSLLQHLAERCGPGRAWSMGVTGAVAGFAVAQGEASETTVEAGGLVMRTAGGAMRLEVPPGLRAFERLDPPEAQGIIVLALHEARLPPPSRPVVAELGPDLNALQPGARGQHLFDLGLGRASARFCVRTGVPDLAAELRRHAGESLFDPASRLLPELLHASPTRVVLSPAGRIEVTDRLGAPRPRGWSGRHTHLLPQHLGSRRPLAADLPPGYVPCAVLGPAGAR